MCFQVVFTKTIGPFATLDRELRSGLYEKKFRIAFADREIQNCFYQLLENSCPECDHQPFIEFRQLKDHVRKVHELFYCEICTDNLKIFAQERRCYTRSQLATHKRVGDPDDKSHKGHPLCDYCELRYLDKDELFRHLRKEHYFCHLCDADGVNLFYAAIGEMRDHFKNKHFLCEEDECTDEQVMTAFRTEIDLRAHIATTHSKGMSRMDQKQTRTIDVEFNYTPRGRGAQGQDAARGHRSRMERDIREFDNEPEHPIVQQPPIRIDSKNDEQFPSLGGPSGPAVQLSNTVRHINFGTSGLARTKENFPSLGGSPVHEKPKSQPTGKQSKMPSASSLLKGPAASSKKSYNKQSKPGPSNPAINKSASDFPALSQSSASSLFKTPAPPSGKSPSGRPATTPTKPPPARPPPTGASGGYRKDPSSDFPSLSQITAKKNRNKNEQLMEDMVETERNPNLKVVPSKHRGLVDDYVSMAAQVSKVQTVKQKDIEMPTEFVQKNVPKLNSADNFPSLGSSGGAGGSSAPQWLTLGSNQKIHDPSKKGKKVNEMPDRNPTKAQNGFEKPQKKPQEQKKELNGDVKEKPKAKTSNNKENKTENVLTTNNFPNLGSDPPLPPGFSSAPKKPPPGFNISDVHGDEYSYEPPPNASKRNQALFAEFEKALESPEVMEEFKLKSKMFRDGKYFARSYYETCKQVLGTSFQAIFPELISLLPDIEKQQVSSWMESSWNFSDR